MGYVEKSPSSIIRKMDREISDDILESLSKMASRCMTQTKKHIVSPSNTINLFKFIENFTLKISQIFFNTQFLDRRIQGLKILMKLINQIKFGITKHLQLQDIKKWIQDNKIFNRLFGTEGHI